MNHNFNPPKFHPTTVYTNGKVSIGEDLIFEWVILSENGWVPIGDLCKEDIEMIWRLMDFNPIFPDELLDDVIHYRDKAV
jgi:hypothetical protein